ncbi:hypothetical protein QCA50_013435 [Cerrena zonata]|uniref:Uncharacterized protein n=1 Tax=Cerrena zonata TaxID=2478898 RepID=A0AAW0FW87_9APHY
MDRDVGYKAQKQHDWRVLRFVLLVSILAQAREYLSQGPRKGQHRRPLNLTAPSPGSKGCPHMGNVDTFSLTYDPMLVSPEACPRGVAGDTMYGVEEERWARWWWLKRKKG